MNSFHDNINSNSTCDKKSTLCYSNAFVAKHTANVVRDATDRSSDTNIGQGILLFFYPVSDIHTEKPVFKHSIDAMIILISLSIYYSTG